MGKKQVMNKVMQLAWRFVRETELPLGEAMHRAYMNVKFNAEINKGSVVHFAYWKANGALREAWGLAAKTGCDLVKGTGNKAPDRNCLYWDVVENAFRCFTRANLVNVFYA